MQASSLNTLNNNKKIVNTSQKKSLNFNFHSSCYKSIRRVTDIFHYLLIDTFLKYSIFFVNVNIFWTIPINKTDLFIRFFAEIELIKNAIRECIIILLHLIDGDVWKLILHEYCQIIIYKQYFILQCYSFFSNSYFKIVKILKIIQLSACIHDLLTGSTIKYNSFLAWKNFDTSMRIKKYLTLGCYFALFECSWIF